MVEAKTTVSEPSLLLSGVTRRRAEKAEKKEKKRKGIQRIAKEEDTGRNYMVMVMVT